jgi:hypothetical protein
MNRLTNISLARPMAAAMVSLFCGLLLALPAQAQNLCTSRASLVNPLAVESARDPGGIGGTGAVAARPGLGGTGISEGGIGGTGIVGVITGFASICVNGVEVQFDASTPVMDNGQRGLLRQLAVGQVVAVRAAGAGEAFSARNIAVIHAAVGPIEALDVATGEFKILGQSARALVPADLAGLRAGNWVRVSGHRLAQGDIAASRIEPIAPQTLAQVYGLVRQIDADTLTVEGTPIRLESAQLPTGLAPGREVLVSGQWDGSTLHAQRVQLEPTRDSLGAVEQMVLEGYIHSVGGRELSLGLGPLSLSRDVQIVGGSEAQLAVNQRVQISGRVGADQRVRVDRIVFRHGASGSGRDATPQSKRTEDASDGKDASSGKSSSEGKDASQSSGSSEGSDSSSSSGSSSDSGKSGDSGSSSGSGKSGDSGSSGGSGKSGRSGSSSRGK